MISNLIQSLFNSAPEPGAPFLLDVKGRKYWYVTEGRPEDIYFFHKRRFSGHINLRWDYHSLEICDMVIFDYRNRGNGLGSQMFALVKELALKEDMREIHGIIHPERPEDRDRLERFYRNQGCRVEKTWFVLQL